MPCLFGSSEDYEDEVDQVRYFILGDPVLCEIA